MTSQNNRAAQNELKVIFRQELTKVWSDPGMVEHCAKTAAYIIEHNGVLFDIDKPRIETRFCFGAGMNAYATNEEMDAASSMARHARTSQEYFIAENLRDLDRWLATLREIREEMSYNWAEGSAPRHMIATGPHYCSQTTDCRLHGFRVVNSWGYHNETHPICWDTELIDKLIAGYEQVRVDFTKRLNTYLKRYGLSKVDSWSFISD